MDVGRALLFLVCAQLGCTQGGLSTNPSSSGQTTGRVTNGVTGATTAATASSTTGPTTSAATSATAGGATTTGTSSSASATSGSGSSTGGGTGATTGATTGSATLAQCLDGGECCGWDWAALDSTCPAQGSLGGWGSAYGSLYAGGTTNTFTIFVDGGAALPISGTAFASQYFALADAGPLFVASDGLPDELYDYGPAGYSQLPTLSGGPFAYGLAIGSGELVLTTDHGALALAYPPGASWSPLWSNQLIGNVLLKQPVMIGAGAVIVAASSYYGGIAALSSATGSYCYTDGCVVRDGGPTTASALEFTGAAANPATGETFFVGLSPSGGVVEELDPNFNCLFLRASACYPVSGACSKSACLVDPSLGGVTLLQAAYVDGALYATGYPTPGSNGLAASGIYSYDLDAGLQLVSDAGYFALTAGP